MRTILIVICLACLPLQTQATGWPRAYVIDSRLAALRTQARLSAPILKRLREGRMVAVLEGHCDDAGIRWIRVAVTRRTRGWILDDAVARPGDRLSENRLASLLETRAGIVRIRAARLAIDRFPRLVIAARQAFDTEAQAVASELSRNVDTRVDLSGEPSAAEVRERMLSDPALDRFVRLGVKFDVDIERRVFIVLRATPR